MDGRSWKSHVRLSFYYLAKFLYWLVFLNRIVPIDVKSVVVSTAIREGGEREWNFAFDRYKKSNVASEKDTLLNALTSTREHDVLKRWEKCILVLFKLP